MIILPRRGEESGVVGRATGGEGKGEIPKADRASWVPGVIAGEPEFLRRDGVPSESEENLDDSLGRGGVRSERWDDVG